ncbi:hypothetical protein [Cohnella sp. GCM10027633]|uniref:hypothetical protein n=1 Tax=unclassified Cohnella TaxID=2636738 RepID=UPI0036430412
MVQILRGISYFNAFVALIGTVVQFARDEYGFALAWLVSGAIAAVLFYALSLILEYAQDTWERVRAIEREVFKNAPPSSPPKLGNSKADIDKLKGFTI